MKSEGFVKTLLNIAIIIISSYLIYQVIKFFMPVLLPFILAFVIVYVLKPVHFFMLDRKVPNLLSLLISYLILLAVIAAVVLILIPIISSQVQEFIKVIPQLEKFFLKTADYIVEIRGKYVVSSWFEEVVTTVTSSLNQFVSSAVRVFTTAGASLAAFLLNLFLSLFISFYILKDWSAFRTTVYSFLRKIGGEEEIAFLSEANRMISRFVKGQLIVATIVGVLTAITLSLLGVRFAVLLGILTAIFDLVPYFGPIFVGILAILLALIDSPWLALWTLVAMVVIQQLESAFISPSVIGRETEIHPVVVLLAFFIGGMLFGFVGIILAIPAAALIKLYIYKRFGIGAEVEQG